LKIGIVVPQFVDDVEIPLRAASRAEQLGVDGAFCFDHLWPWGRTEGNALAQFPLLGALAGEHATLTLGTLVARVGVASNEAVVRALTTSNELTNGRFIAGIGAGGGPVARREDTAYGVDHPSRTQRVAMLEDVAAQLRAAGIEVWISGKAQPIVDVARRTHSSSNIWTDGEPVPAESNGVPVTWAVTSVPDVEVLVDCVREARRLAHRWIVFRLRGIGRDPEAVVEKLAKARDLADKRDGGH
jgi:alkanesulfonate monooxygenase SsuD/methylene tetrahydromethanopterin reductase-like flavin-dependent oxidoreductase (luciferase family)